jgi:hypothetical protein
MLIRNTLQAAEKHDLNAAYQTDTATV